MEIKRDLIGKSYTIGYRILENKGTVVIGMSLNNSYFTREKIVELLTVTGPLFARIIIVIPDYPTISTFEALGYTTQQAKKEALSKGKNLYNRCSYSIDLLNASQNTQHIKIINWECDIENNPAYQQQKQYLNNLYVTNNEFYEDVNEAVKSILKDRIKKTIDLEKACGIASSYLIMELAFMLASNEIFDAEYIGEIYHKPWPLLFNLLNNKYDLHNRKIGSIIIY